MSPEPQLFDLDEKTGLRFHMWKGQKRWHCNQVWESGQSCQFNASELAELWEHIRSGHSRSGKPLKTQREPPSHISPLVDSNGNPIVVADEPSEFSGIHFKDESD